LIDEKVLVSYCTKHGDRVLLEELSARSRPTTPRLGEEDIMSAVATMLALALLLVVIDRMQR
jgi:hypothetical protein